MSVVAPSVEDMAEILVLHHALGLTSGVVGFADTLREAGHTVHTPDLFEGRIFDDVNDGVAYAQSLGEEVDDRARAAAAGLPERLVYVGFSLGGFVAEQLAATRPHALGCVLFHCGVPLQYLGPGFTEESTWPEHVPLQMHIADQDPFDDAPICQAIAAGSPAAEVHLYPASTHLFTDPTSPDYDADLAQQAIRRTVAFVDQLDAVVTDA